MAGVRRPMAGTEFRRQAGAYAVEYALIFPVFLLLLYGALAYGLIFGMRLGLQHAAEEGARAALRYQVPPSSSDLQVTLREAAAEAVARDAADWLQNLGNLTVKADICLASDENCLTSSGVELADNLACGKTISDGCQIVVVVEYPYETEPVFPALPGLGVVMPKVLQGRARALLDGRALSPL